MKRTKIFSLVMAIFWTLIAVAAVLLIKRSGVSGTWSLLVVILAVVAVAGNWLRYFRAR